MICYYEYKKLIVFIIYYLESIKIKTCGYHMSSSLLKIISINYEIIWKQSNFLKQSRLNHNIVLNQSYPHFQVYTFIQLQIKHKVRKFYKKN